MAGIIGAIARPRAVDVATTAIRGGRGATVAAATGWTPGAPTNAAVRAGGWRPTIGQAAVAAAVVGAGLLVHHAMGSRVEEYLVHFADQPDLDGVPPGEVYAALRAHHERHAPAVERELHRLQDEGKVGKFSGIVGANGFVVEVVRRHRDEVSERLATVPAVGDVVAAPMS